MPNGLGKKKGEFVSEYITGNTSFFSVPLHVKYLRRSLDILYRCQTAWEKKRRVRFPDDRSSYQEYT